MRKIKSHSGNIKAITRKSKPREGEDMLTPDGSCSQLVEQDSHRSTFPTGTANSLLFRAQIVALFFVPSLAFTFAPLQSSCITVKQCNGNLDWREAAAPATGSGKPTGSVTAAKTIKSKAEEDAAWTLPPCPAGPGSKPPGLRRMQPISSEACHQGHGFIPGFYTKDSLLGGVFGHVATDKCLPPIASSITSSPAPVKSISQLAVETLRCTPGLIRFLSERALRLLVALSQITRWMPLLAVCHSSDPPENDSCMQTKEDQQLCFADF